MTETLRPYGHVKDLNECPFCQTIPFYPIFHDSPVKCHNCGAKGPMVKAGSDGVKAWNERGEECKTNGDEVEA